MLEIFLAFVVGFIAARIPAGNLPHPKEWRRRYKNWLWGRAIDRQMAKCARGEHPRAEWVPDAHGNAWCYHCERTFTVPPGKEYRAPAQAVA